ncbi:MAG: RNA polymerase subunit sigma-70 [Stenomitos rutilans HA7619-LM2]|jgi:RNA polymerase sigma-70 factor (ECF subfamily)|nr:RNA polymerase subunit sigma-70 [Stenomitos rutilans HA7619-LM2]
MDARRAAELAARNSYGRLVAYLAAQTRDVAAAEDALGEAFLAALNTWADSGIPQNPEAWLLTIARHRLIDVARRTQVQTKVLNKLKLDGLEWQAEPSLDAVIFQDDRLKLLFLCAHPAIDAAIHTPLMLQTVLGLNAVQIASAFLVAPATMSQRLVRAKAKIRDAGIALELPDARDLPTRLIAVLEAIYAAFTHAWETVDGGDPRHQGLAEEAVWLARLCVQLMPQEPEVRGLLALMLYCEARRETRRTTNGRYVPLSQQDTQLWAQPMIDEAERELAKAATYKQLGRFQLEAAIQSIHAQRATTQQVNWEALALLYEGLVQLSPTLGAYVSQAAAIAEAKGSDQGLQQLAALPTEAVKHYQPYWALKAHLFKQLGREPEAQQAYTQAIGLTEDAAIREFLLHQSRSN